MNYITQALYSFFKPMTSTMRWESTHIFDPQANLQPSLLVSLLESWAKADPKPASILCDLRVTSIMHAKMPQPPEHEFLLVKMEDRENASRIFLLERTVDPALVTGPGERPTAMESVKQLCAAMTTSSSSLVSVEEGLPQLDRLTVSTVQAAHVLSDSLENKKGGYQAVDHFFGFQLRVFQGVPGRERTTFGTRQTAIALSTGHHCQSCSETVFDLRRIKGAVLLPRRRYLFGGPTSFRLHFPQQAHGRFQSKSWATSQVED